MSLILGDGFDHYPTALLLSKWDGAFGIGLVVTGGGGNVVSTTYGRLGSQGVLTSGGMPGLTKNLYAANAGYGFVGTAFYVPAFSVGGFIRPIFSFFDPPTGSSTMQSGLWLENDGSFSLRSGTFGSGPGAPFATTQPGKIAAGTWYYIEAKVKIHNTLGEIAVRVNEQVIPWIGGGTSFTGNTRRAGTNNYFTTIGLGGGDGNTVSGWSSAYYDDFYYCDDQGAVNNSYLGDVALQAIYPNGVGSSTVWTKDGSAPAASNWQSVNEHSPDDDVTYVRSAVTGDLDMYTMDDVSATASGIKGLLMNARIKKDDATARTYSTMVKDVLNGGTSTAVAIRSTPYGAYTNQQDVSELSSATSAAWTVAAVNAMEAGEKVIT